MKYYKDGENAIHFYAHNGGDNYGDAIQVCTLNNHFEIGLRSPDIIKGYIEISEEEFMKKYSEVRAKLEGFVYETV